MIEADSLAFSFDDRVLFHAFSLRLKKGEFVQIAGENGAGKTTLLRILCGLARPESGGVFWDGQPITRVRDAYHSQLLWLGHKPGIKQALTADENLGFFFPRLSQQERAAALAEAGLAGYEDIPLGQLSAGQQRRVALTRLWLTSASLWILDEPFTALDASAIEVLTRRLEEHVLTGGSVILTTHQPLRTLRCPQRVIRLAGDAEVVP